MNPVFWWCVLPEHAPRSLHSTLARNPEVSLLERDLKRGHSGGNCLSSGYLSSASSSMVRPLCQPAGEKKTRELHFTLLNISLPASPLTQTLFLQQAEVCVCVCAYVCVCMCVC